MPKVERERGRLAALIGAGALLLASFFLFVLNTPDVPADFFFMDFAVFLEAGKRAAAGENIYRDWYLLHGTTQDAFPYLYPPFPAWCMSLVHAVDVAVLVFAWKCAAWLALAGFVLIAGYLLGITAQRKASWPLRTLSVGALTFFSPVTINGFTAGQVNAFVLFLITAALLMFVKRRSLAAGFCLAPAALIKATPLMLLIVPLKSRERRSVMYTLLLFALCALALAAALPLHVYSGLGRHVAASIERITAVHNFSIYNLLGALGVMNPGVKKILSLLVILPLLAAICRFRVHDDRDLLRAYAAVSCLMILAAPVVWPHHFVWLILPCAIVMVGRRAGSSAAAVRQWLLCYVLLASPSICEHLLPATAGVGALWLRALPSLVAVMLLIYALKRPEPAL